MSGALDAELLRVAEQANHLRNDPIFLDWLEALIREHTQLAIILQDPAEREANRQVVLALGRVRASLDTAEEMVRATREQAKTAKSFE